MRLSASGTEALKFQLVALNYEAMSLANSAEILGQRVGFIKRNYPAASKTGEVMMVMTEGVGQLQFVFPADLQPLHNAQLFKKCHRPIDARPVNFATGFD